MLCGHPLQTSPHGGSVPTAVPGFRGTVAVKDNLRFGRGEDIGNIQGEKVIDQRQGGVVVHCGLCCVSINGGACR